VGTLTELGRKAGLQLGDRILEVNGKAFTNYEEFHAATNHKPGDKNSYLVKRGEQEFEITITNLPLGFKRALFLSGPSYLLGFSYVLIGTLVFLMKPLQVAQMQYAFSILVSTPHQQLSSLIRLQMVQLV